MAFTRDTFIRVAGAGSNAPAFYTYRTDDTAAQVDGSGYFDGLADILEVGDLIYAHVDADGTDAYGFFVVLSNDGTTVDCSNILAAGTIDSD